MDNFYLDMWRKSRRFVYQSITAKGITMELPFQPLEDRRLPMREQIIARIMQLSRKGHHTPERLAKLSDHALLLQFQITLMILADREIDEAWDARYNAGVATYVQQDEPMNDGIDEDEIAYLPASSKVAAEITIEDFHILDMELGLIPEVELNDGGIYTFVCRYSGMNFYYEVSEYNMLGLQGI